MKRIPFYVALAVLCLAMTDCTSKKKMEIKMKPYPQTAKVDVSDNYHGTVVADPYRWLEDDNSAETAAWVAAENEVTFDYLSQIPYRPAIDERLTELWNYEKIGAPTKVGDRYVLEEMLKEGYNLGGEQSGHIIFSKYATTGDGIITAIKMMEVMLAKKKTLGQLASPVVIYPQVLKNVRVTDKTEAQNDADVRAAVEAAAEKLGENGRILVRESGTEPVVRVMVEADSVETCEKYVDDVIEVIKNKGYVIG